MALRATDIIKKNCLTCNAIFTTQYRNTLRGRGKFCTKSCSNKNDINRKTKREKQLNTGTKDTYRKFYKRPEHRVVMEKVLGRKLEKHEIVHHKDEDKRNNNPENLQLYSSNAEHLRDHLRKNIGTCLIKGCDSEQKRKQMCFKHYARVKNHGNPFINLKVRRKHHGSQGT
jgi:HNH endonuclease